MDMVLTVIGVLGLVGLFISGISYERTGDKSDLILALMCSSIPVMALIKAFNVIN